MKNRKAFACRKSGGIVLGYREKFAGDIEVIETANKFVLWCKISSKLMNLNSDLLLGMMYIPQDTLVILPLSHLVKLKTNT